MALPYTILKPSNYRTIEAKDGREALKKIKKKKIDLILLDIMMPEIDGFEVLKNVRNMPELEKIPVIMMPAKSQKTDIMQAASLKVNGYIIKPFRSADLLKKVSEVLCKEIK